MNGRTQGKLEKVPVWFVVECDGYVRKWVRGLENKAAIVVAVQAELLRV